MSLINITILLLCLQPLIIYKAMFAHKEKEDKSELEFQLSFLVIAPSFVFFYLDAFWDAVVLLGGVSVFGVILAKVFEHKAKRSLTLQDFCAFLVAWLIIFSAGYGVVSFLGGIGGEKVPVSIHAIELIADVPISQAALAETPQKPLLPNMLASLYYLASMTCVFLIKVYEAHRGTKEEFSGFLLLVLSVAGSITPFFSEYYLLSLAFNFLVFISFLRPILVYKETDPSAGAVMFFYGYAFIMATVLSLTCRGVWWLLS